MTDILLINPAEKNRAGNRQGAKKMAKRKSLVRNPKGKVGALARRGGRRMFAGLNPKKTVTDALVGQPGMLMAQFFAKKFGKDGKSFFENDWDWENYAWATAGSFAAGLAGNMIMPGKGNKMLEHGLALTLNKFLQDKLVQKNATLKSALGNYNRLSNRYLNPNASLNLPQRQAGGGMGGRIEPEGPLGGDMSRSSYLGGSEPFSHAFIRG